MNIPKRSRFLLYGALAVALLGLVIRPIRQRFQPVLLAPSRFVQNPHDIATLAFAEKDGHLVAAQTGEGGQVTVWNSNAQQKQSWKASGESVYLSPDGRHLLTTTYTRPDKSTHCIWYDASTGRVLNQWTAKGLVYDVARDLSVLASADSLQSSPKRTTALYLIEVPTGRVRGQLVVPLTDVWKLRFTRNSRYLRVPGDKAPSRLIRVSDLHSMMPLPPLQSVNISQDERTVTGLSDDGTLHFWRLPSHQHTTVATGLRGAQWFYHLDDDRIVVNGEVGQGKERKDITQVRSADGTKIIQTLDGRPDVLSPNGHYMAFKVRITDSRGYSRGDTAYYDVRDVATGKSLAQLDVSVDSLGQRLVQSGFVSQKMAFSPDERHIAYATSDGLLRLYDLDNHNNPARGPISTSGGSQVLDFQESIFDAVVLPNGGVAASGTDNQNRGDRFVRVANSSGRVSSYPAVVGNGDVSVLGVSPDGKTLVGSSQWGVWLLDLKHGRRQETPISSGPNGIQYYSSYPEGRPLWLEGANKPFAILSTGNFGDGPATLTFWDNKGQVQKNKVVAPQEKRAGNRSFLLDSGLPSPDGHKLMLLWNGVQHKREHGKQVTSVEGEGLIEVCDTATGRVLSRLDVSGRTGWHGSLGRPTWSRDASRIAISDEMGRVLIWNAASGQRIGQLSGTRVEIGSVSSSFTDSLFNRTPSLAFTPDGRFLAAGRDDGSIYLYSLTTFLPVAQIGKAVTQLGWMQFSPDGHTLYGIVANGKAIFSWDVPHLNG